MEGVYLGLVVFLFILAVFDLMVGVSNDAVNFLNSAIGAKVAKFRTIIIVAAVGIFFGATCSNGMMEIARNGIFHPSFFTFKELMFIFLAVMASDIVLLDIFNTLGMPTSTTVSMVFELLGGTFAIVLMKTMADPSMSLVQLMNTSKALSVIMAIFVSVAIAFFFGVVIQYLSRILFTFTYRNDSLKWKIGIFGGIAATAIIYFMLIKGIENFSFVSKDFLAWIDAHTWMICGLCLVFFTIVTQILYFLKVNVFKVLVLLGTFALAMAFAGNDLVNFIGVPLAGFSSFQDYVANGHGQYDTYLMSALDGPATTPIVFLVLAGLVMVISLATSKKAQNVVKTSVDLSKQDEGDEMFGSSKMARILVRASSNMASTIEEFVPDSIKKFIDRRFNSEEMVLPAGAAFDEIRATVNLVVASLLIALGTSLKLPLSTTYVTFMVAMGSSLADRAWGRESAVFRITGVLSVIGGWFITAGAAFILCFLVTLFMNVGGFVVAGLLVALSIFLLIRSNIRYNRRKQNEAGDVIFQKILATDDRDESLKLLSEHIVKSQAEFLNYVNDCYLQVTDGFIAEDLKKLEKSDDSIRKEKVEMKKVRRKEIIGFRRIDPDIAIEKNTWFHLGRNSCEDMLYCLRRICDPCLEHVDNNFAPLGADRIKEFLPQRDTMLFMLKRAAAVIETRDLAGIAKVRKQCEEFNECLSNIRTAQMNRMQSTKDNISTAYVYLNLLQETHEMVSSLKHLLRAAKHFISSEI